MTQVAFFKAYEPIVAQILQYQHDYAELSTAKRAEGAIKNAEDMNRLFTNAVKDEMLGQHIDTSV